MVSHYVLRVRFSRSFRLRVLTLEYFLGSFISIYIILGKVF
jgi:hypothetical protein